MSGLNPTVTGALIAGGFAVIAGALAAMNTRATMRATMRANRDEDRSQRYWEKKTALYEELYEAMDLGSALSDLEAHGLKDGIVQALTSLSNLESRTYLYATSGGVLPDFLSLVTST